MIDFLDNVGLSNNIVKRMNDVYNEANLFNLSCNEGECIRIIELLKHIGIKKDVIESLLINKLDWFLNSCDEVVNILRRIDIAQFVMRVNDDPFAIEDYS